MSTAVAWKPSAWRGAVNPTYYQHQTSTPQRSASVGQHDSSDGHVSLNSNSRPNSYLTVGGNLPADEKARYSQHKLPSLTDPYTDASTFHSRLHQRPTPPSDAQMMSGPWPQPPAHHQASDVSSCQLHSGGTVGNERQFSSSTAPLTLQIPDNQELPRISTMFNTSPAGQHYHDQKPIHPPAPNSTMLPPFASFHDHAKRADSFSEARRTPPSAQTTCQSCSKLQPMVAEVATAVADLDESIQLLCNKPWSRSSDYPKDNVLHTVQWILERLRCGKVEMQAAIRAVHSASASQPTPTSGMASRNISPSMPLKRPAELWDREDSPAHKRPNTGRAFEEPLRTQTIPMSDRVAHHVYHTQGHLRPAHITPPPMEAGPQWPKAPSPGHAMRSLPSPSSVAYPSGTPSLAPHHAHSPTMTHITEAVHASSADAATSAHIADLQHQVTLKTLALQSLQSEYSSLLQRVQRLNVKTQTMDRKASVADNEVNELTNKNEDLTQQLQSTQEQFEDSEKRRDQEREDYTREKDQWLQMLDQGRRLQAKILQENKTQSDRIAALLVEIEQARSERNPDLAVAEGAITDAERQHRASFYNARSENVASLKADIEILRSSLEEAKSHRQQLDERAQEVLRQSSDIAHVIDRALGLRSTDIETYAQQPPTKAIGDPHDASSIRSVSQASPPSPPKSTALDDDSTAAGANRNFGSFRPLNTFDATSSATHQEAPLQQEGEASPATTPTLSLTVTGSPTNKSTALVTAANGIPTPITPLSAADQQSYTPVAPTSNPIDDAAASSTTMPPPPRPIV